MLPTEKQNALWLSDGHPQYFSFHEPWDSYSDLDKMIFIILKATKTWQD